jgi:hypothetical protein
MKRIRTEMWAVARKAHYVRDVYGTYLLFDKRIDAEKQFPNDKPTKVIVTITEKAKS